VKIKSATVIHKKTEKDEVLLEVYCPSPNKDKIDNNWLTMRFTTTNGYGKEYVENNFDIIPQVIDLSNEF
jgi:hypothetical protein